MSSPLSEAVPLPKTLSAVSVVLTHRRPRLAAQVVRSLLEEEGLSPSQVIVVVNGEGGLDDPHLEAAVTVVRLEENVGPAGGFARAFRFARDASESPWVYACEDDAGLSQLRSPRLGELIERIEAFERDVPGPPVGLVLASGWDVDRRTGRTSRHKIEAPDAPFEEVDFNAWEATLVSRRVLDAGVFPDESLFWWAEELDFGLRVQGAGFRVLVDTAARLPSVPGSAPARDLRIDRPGREDEPWCSYYMARNWFLLRRRFGTPRWTFWHLMKSARRFQLAPSWAHRVALIRGLVDGFLGRTGRNPAFTRTVGEW